MTLERRDQVYSLLLNIASRDWCQRQDALEDLWKMAVDTGARDIRAAVRVAARALVNDPEAVVRSDAIDTLGDLGGPGDHRILMSATYDPEWVVRSSAVSAAAEIIGARAVPRIRELLRDRNAVVRRSAAVALFEVVGCSAEEDLSRLLKSERNKIARVGFLYVAAMCGRARAREELEVLAKDPNMRVQSPARSSLDEVRGATLKSS
ncbi:MAG: HEAT repeat domain-containing protein [Armatimonadetes bacterium]|nr:HEAT repeat domain-containing protein [Armatimonadota bacterium]